MKTFQNQTIKLKLVIIITFTSIIAVVAGLGTYLVFDMVSIKNEMKKNAELNATLVAEYSIVPLLFNYTDEANNVLSKLSAIPNVLDAYIYNKNNQILAVYHKAAEIPDTSQSITNTKAGFSSGYLYIHHAILYKGKTYGTLYLRISAANLEDKFLYNLLVMVILIIILFISISIVANRIQKIISGPILKLAELTASISQSQDFTVQLEPQGNDEVGILYQQFNKMLSQLLKWKNERDVAEKEINFLAHVFKNINENVSITDLNDTIIFVNQSFIKTYGYSEEELMGQKVDILRSDNNSPEVTSEILPATLKGGWQGELMNKCKDGREFPILLRTTIIYDKMNQPVALVGVSIDITEHKREEKEIMLYRDHLEELVKQRTAELEEEKEHAQSADRLKSAFLATMSHELRTPLNSIIGFTGILMQERPGPLNPEQKKQLGMAQQSARHLLSLINDVLDISKIESGQLKMNIETFSLPEVIFKVVETNTPMAEKKNIQITTDIAPDIDEMTSDKLRVQQILLNLVNNAVKFTEAGSVNIVCFKSNDLITIKVIDTGMGIEKDQMDILFKPFMQIDTGLTRKHEGTGLGLSICKRLLDMLNGTVEIESEYGKGSTFIVKMPIIKSKS